VDPDKDPEAVMGELGIDWIILKLKNQSEVMDLLKLDQDRAQGQALVNMVMNLWVPKEVGFSSCRC
jgi:hypothetical protein